MCDCMFPCVCVHLHVYVSVCASVCVSVPEGVFTCVSVYACPEKSSRSSHSLQNLWLLH